MSKPPTSLLLLLLLLLGVAPIESQFPNYHDVSPVWDIRGVPYELFGTSLATRDRWIFVGAPGKYNGAGVFFIMETGTLDYYQMPNVAGVESLGGVISVSPHVGLVQGQVSSTETGCVVTYYYPPWVTRSRVFFTQMDVLFGSNDFMTDRFGDALANNGVMVAIGDPLNQRVYLYLCSKSDCAPTTVLAPLNATEGGSFGATLAMSGSLLMIGSPGANANQGVVDLYAYSPFSVTHIATLVAPNGKSGDGFGTAIAAFGQTGIVVGAPNAGQGAVYLFQNCTFQGCSNATTSWTDTTGAPGNGFGTTIATFGTLVGISSPFKINSANQAQGTAFIYDCSQPTCVLQSTLYDPNGDATERFGASLLMYQDTVIVGAPGKTVYSLLQFGGIYEFYNGPLKFTGAGIAGIVIGSIFGTLLLIFCVLFGGRAFCSLLEKCRCDCNCDCCSRRNPTSSSPPPVVADPPPQVELSAKKPEAIGRAESLGLMVRGIGPTGLHRVNSLDDLEHGEKKQPESTNEGIPLGDYSNPQPANVAEID